MNATVSTNYTDTLRRWNTLAKAVNKLRAIEESLGDEIRSGGMMLLELHRMAHRQFPWQMSRPTGTYTMRYLNLYKDAALESIIQKATGLSVDEIFLTGLSLFGALDRTFALHLPPTIEIPNLSSKAVDRFFQHFSVSLEELKVLLADEQQLNDRFPYSYNSLRAYPLIRMRSCGLDTMVSPMPTLLFWRFTAGLYYAIYTHAGFANAYGNAFQNYVGSILQRGTASTRAKVFPEEEYHVGRYLKRTVDWIVEEKDALLFIEAKTKRMVMEAKVEIVSLDALTAELEKMASMIVQTYKSIRDYREDLYPSCKFNPSSRIFPILVTLEDWFIFGPKLSAELQGKIREGFAENKLPEMWLDEMPYTVCSIQELEQAIQIMRTRGIGTVMASKVDAEHRTWALDVHLRTKFKEDIKDIRCLFQDEYEQLVPELIGGGISS